MVRLRSCTAHAAWAFPTVTCWVTVFVVTSGKGKTVADLAGGLVSGAEKLERPSVGGGVANCPPDAVGLILVHSPVVGV